MIAIFLLQVILTLTTFSLSLGEDNQQAPPPARPPQPPARQPQPPARQPQPDQNLPSFDRPVEDILAGLTLKDSTMLLNNTYVWREGRVQDRARDAPAAVSYTHLTLPTIYSV